VADVDWPSWPAATVPLAHPGLLVAERYRLLTQIGVGAMGAVWLATDLRLSRQVALKQVVLEPGWTCDRPPRHGSGSCARGGSRRGCSTRTRSPSTT